MRKRTRTPWTLGLAILAVTCMGLVSSSAWSQARTVSIIVGFAPGGNLDLNARIIAKLVQPSVSEPWIVVNRPGAAAAIARAEVMRAKPDGRTLSMDSGAFLLQGQLGDVPWKGADDFSQVAIVLASYSVHFVRADAPWKTMKELVKHSRKNPDAITYGVTGPNTVGTIRYLMLREVTGISWREIPYVGDAQAITALLGGHIDTAAAAVAAVMPHVKAGKIRILAVPGDERAPSIPDIPTFKEQGWAVSLPSLNLMLGPRGIPNEILQPMAAAIERATTTAEYRKFAEDSGAELYTRFGSAMKTVISDEEAKYRKVAPLLQAQMKAAPK